MPERKSNFQTLSRQRRRTNIIISIAGGVVATVASWFILLPLITIVTQGPHASVSPDLLTILTSVIVFIIGAALTWNLFCSEPDPAKCHRCRYDLSMNTTGLCPECGEHVPPYQQRFLKKQAHQLSQKNTEDTEAV